MAYSNLWTLDHPPVGTNRAADLDDAIRRLRLDIQERLLTITGGGSMTDPISTDSLASLRALADTKPSINATTSRIPRKSGAGTLGDSSISDDGTNATANGNLTVTGQLTQSGSPRCSLLHSGGATLSAAAAISFAGTEDIDVGSMHTNADDTKATIPVGAGGTYLLMFVVDANGANLLGQQFYFRKNGTTQIGPTFQVHTLSGSAGTFQMSWLAALAAGDYVEVYFSAGSNLPIDSARFVVARMF